MDDITSSATPSSPDTIERVREYHRVIVSFSRIASESPPAERLMHHLVAQVASATHIKHVKVLRYRADRGDLLVEAGVGWKPGVVGHATLGVDHRSPPGRSIQTAAPVAIANLPTDPEYRYSDLLREHGLVSVLNVPIMIDARSWGVLEVDTVRQTTFDEWDVGFLSTLANVLGGALGRLESERKLLEAGAQKTREQAHFDIVVRELQHRVKNNLQIIVSFIALKCREAKSSETREKLESVIGRVQAIALAHDQLSIGDASSSVDFGDYLRALCANIDPRRHDVSIDVDAANAAIPLDRAVPAGLIVNELVTNCIKYAFGNAGGQIRVTFKLISNSSEANISVEDNGKGMPLPPHKGFGLSLVEGFARQLSGKIAYVQVEVGSRTELLFPLAY
jgi:two-component sensor histidine kinase